MQTQIHMDRRKTMSMKLLVEVINPICYKGLSKPLKRKFVVLVTQNQQVKLAPRLPNVDMANVHPSPA